MKYILILLLSSQALANWIVNSANIKENSFTSLLEDKIIIILPEKPSKNEKLLADKITKELERIGKFDTFNVIRKYSEVIKEPLFFMDKHLLCIGKNNPILKNNYLKTKDLNNFFTQKSTQLYFLTINNIFSLNQQQDIYYKMTFVFNVENTKEQDSFITSFFKEGFTANIINQKTPAILTEFCKDKNFQSCNLLSKHELYKWQEILPTSIIKGYGITAHKSKNPIKKVNQNNIIILEFKDKQQVKLASKHLAEKNLMKKNNIKSIKEQENYLIFVK